MVLGKTRKDLRNVIHNNHKIAHVLDIVSWMKNGKDYFYDKNDVFNEFFYEESRVGPAIRKCCITSYDELERNVLRVSSFI